MNLTKRPGAPDEDGLHVAGFDGAFSEAVQSDHPRCPNPECQALLVGASEDRLCGSCEAAIEAAEAEAEDRRRRGW